MDFNIFIFIQIFHLISLLCCCKVCCESLIFKVRLCFQCCIIIEWFPCIICPLVKLVTSFCFYCGWLCRMLWCLFTNCCDHTCHLITLNSLYSNNLTGCSCYSSFIRICWLISECDLILIRYIIFVSIFTIVYNYNVIIIDYSYCNISCSYKGISINIYFFFVTIDHIIKMRCLWSRHWKNICLCILVYISYLISLFRNFKWTC